MKFRYKKPVLWLLVILQILIIFSFSLQNAKQSTVLSKGITEKVKSREKIEEQIAQEKNKSGERLYKSDYAVEMVAKRQFSILETIIRKLAHAFLFFLLGMLIILLVRAYKIDRKIAAILGILYSGTVAFVDETIQLFSEGRAGRIGDVMIDIGGAAIAAIIFIAGGLLYEKIKSRCSKVDS